MSTRWALRIVLVVTFLVALIVAFDLVFPQPDGALRRRSLRNRIECRLEEWGFIKFDVFRHIEG
jgi:hypothetical protein